MIEKLIDSPSTSDILEKRGVIVGRDVKKRLEMFSRWLCENSKKGYLYLRPKAKGNQSIDEKVKYTILPLYK